MFCTDEDPCPTHMDKPIKVATRKKKPVWNPDLRGGGGAPVSAPVVLKESDGPEWGVTPTAKSNRFEVSKTEKTELPQDELLDREALTNLLPLLRPSERQAVLKDLHRERTNEERKYAAQVKKGISVTR